MKKYFLAGLITLLPLIVTYIIIVFCIGLITAPFERLVHFLLSYLPFFDHEFGIFTRDQLIHVVSKILIIGTLITFIFTVGMLGRWVIFKSWGYFFDALICKIPLINKVYGPSKDLVDALFIPRPDATRYAVLVSYPSLEQKSIGIATGEYSAELYGQSQTYVSVLIPSTPNATVGYLCSFLKSEVTYLSISADEALKLVMSFKISTLQ